MTDVNVFLTVADFSVRVAPDRTALLIDARMQLGSMTVPVPATNLVALGVRDREIARARYTVPTGLTPAGVHHWIELVFGEGPPWQLGPLGAGDAAKLALAFDHWRCAHPLELQPTDVTEEQLRADPTRWHMRRIRVTGWWLYQLECSRFANAWLQPRDEAAFGDGTHRATVVGTWLYPDAKAEGGYGHMGCWPGELRAETIEILETARNDIDNLTGMLKRFAFPAELQRARLASADAGGPISLALLDLDRFKQFNDQHGHDAGDTAIQQFAAGIRKAMKNEVLARWAGDKIAIALASTSRDSAHELVEALQSRFKSRGELTFSAAVVEITAGETYEELSARVTELLAQAKRSGGNCIVVG